MFAAASTSWSRYFRDILPGLALCGVLAGLALALQSLEERALGHPYVEAIVLAILFGIAVRAVWTPPASFRPGIAVSAKQVLEIAVAALGASISFGAILASGPALLGGIVALVGVALGAGYAICRGLGLPGRMSILIAAGNAICGNSAIAAIAPVIGAQARDVAAAIAFTAVLGVVVVIGLPLLIPALGLAERQYGILAGLTVYAVPQVLAATVPVGLLAAQVGTLVKLVRVLLLGPLVVLLSLLARHLPPEPGTEAPRAGRLGFGKLVPWFILAFLGLAALRSLGLVPDAAAQPVTLVSKALTVVAMAALGLGVDLRVLARVGARVTLAVCGSLLILLVASIALVFALGSA